MPRREESANARWAGPVARSEQQASFPTKCAFRNCDRHLTEDGRESRGAGLTHQGANTTGCRNITLLPLRGSARPAAATMPAPPRAARAVAVVAFGLARAHRADEQPVQRRRVGHGRADEYEELAPRRELERALGHGLQLRALRGVGPAQPLLVLREHVERAGGARRTPHHVEEEDLEGDEAQARERRVEGERRARGGRGRVRRRERAQPRLLLHGPPHVPREHLA
mmetsp:Transcript_40332/g.94131  ORF Transcript_40332/g.94131 Transcript_40332/m.94131 type:complete len:226 (+) Transcript_40332:329-1006(+)